MVGHVYGNICLAIRAESSIIHLFVSSSLHLFKEEEKGERGEKEEKEERRKRRKRGKTRKRRRRAESKGACMHQYSSDN